MVQTTQTLKTLPATTLTLKNDAQIANVGSEIFRVSFGFRDAEIFWSSGMTLAVQNRLLRCEQCDQIGQFLQVPGNKLSHKSSPSILVAFWDISNNVTILWKECGYFFGNFGVKLGNFLFHQLVTLNFDVISGFTVHKKCCTSVVLVLFKGFTIWYSWFKLSMSYG